jgi:hypothetical protein
LKVAVRTTVSTIHILCLRALGGRGIKKHTVGLVQEGVGICLLLLAQWLLGGTNKRNETLL